MIWNQQIVEQIVRDVMAELRKRSPEAPAGVPAPVIPASSSAPTPTALPAMATSNSVALAEKVITAEVLRERINGHRDISIGLRAVLTPSAQDFLRAQGVSWRREDVVGTSGQAASKTASTKTARWLTLVSTATSQSKAAIEDLVQGGTSLTSELVGLPAEGVSRAINVLARGEADGVILLTSETPFATCRANRSPYVRGAEVSDIRTLSAARKQLGANLLCLNPTNKSFFELRKLLKDCVTGNRPEVPAGWKE